MLSQSWTKRMFVQIHLVVFLFNKYVILVCVNSRLLVELCNPLYCSLYHSNILLSFLSHVGTRIHYTNEYLGISCTICTDLRFSDNVEDKNYKNFDSTFLNLNNCNSPHVLKTAKLRNVFLIGHQQLHNSITEIHSYLFCFDNSFLLFNVLSLIYNSELWQSP